MKKYLQAIINVLNTESYKVAKSQTRYVVVTTCKFYIPIEIIYTILLVHIHEWALLILLPICFSAIPFAKHIIIPGLNKRFNCYGREVDLYEKMDNKERN